MLTAASLRLGPYSFSVYLGYA
uniref:Uncharacterized protein n=1 Tax=Anguilla anguilla TaxID=7936 RepID=A0A0E9SS25_ANGAN